MDRTQWRAEVKKQLALQGKTLKDVADELGWKYGYTRQLVSYKDSMMNIRKLSEHLGIEPFKKWE